jgi:UDP-glucose 4-epimerase
LAEAHVKALTLFDRKNDNVNLDARVYNLGTGKGTSVLELIDAFKEATKVDVPFVIEGRRPGDVAECYCDASKAYEELGWKAKYDVYDMCRDSWKWQSQNPNGYL